MPTYDDINRLYQQYLGRPASQEDANNWISGTYGATDLSGIEQQIASSGEAQNYRGSQGGGGGGGGSSSGGGPTYDQINGLYQQYLGRSPNQDEYQNWVNGTYGATDLGGIASQIQSSGEAQDYARAHGGGGGSSGGGGGGGGGGGSSNGGFATPADPYHPYATPGADNPFAPWSGHFEAPPYLSLPNAPTFTPPDYTAPPAFSYDQPAPTYTPPPAFSYGDFKAPTYTPPPAFSYADFKGPSAADALADPGYQFRLDQGTAALQNAASARGTLNDSGTLKSLMDYGQGAASQEYQNTWQRAYDAYGRNYQTAADTYNTNYKTQYQDPYQAAYQGALTEYTQNRGNALDAYNTNYKTQYQDPYQAALNQWTTGYGNALNTYNTNYKTQYQDPYATAYQAAKDAYAPQLANWQTQAANIQHQNDLTNTNAWNDYLLGFQDYQNRRGTSANFALQS